jgi:enoyl-CoA hydratase/carnithine racemase
MPQAIASELLLTWENIGAQRAYEVGIINRVVPVDQLLWEATNIAVALSNNWALDWGEDLPVSPRPILWRIVVKEDKMRSQFDFQTGDVSRNISETCSSLKPLIYYFLV